MSHDDAEMSAGAATPIRLPHQPRILVVSLRRIGDVLLTTPLIRSLRRAWPGASIDSLVFASTAGILKGNPDIDQIIAMPARPTAWQTIRLALQLLRRYDLAVSTQPGDRPTVFAMLAGRTHAGLTDADAPWLGRIVKSRLLHRSAPTASTIHRVEQMLCLADALGVERVPEVVCPAGALENISPGENYAVIHAAPMFRY